MSQTNDRGGPGKARPQDEREGGYGGSRPVEEPASGSGAGGRESPVTDAVDADEALGNRVGYGSPSKQPDGDAGA